MFSVERWQLDQNSCLPNDNVLCSIAAVLTAAEVRVLRHWGWGGLHFGAGGLNLPDGPRAGSAGQPGLGTLRWP